MSGEVEETVLEWSLCLSETDEEPEYREEIVLDSCSLEAEVESG